MYKPWVGIPRAGLRPAAALFACAGLFSAVAWFSSVAPAQDDGPPAAQNQPAAQNDGQPARAIRLSYVDGKVQLSQGGQVTAQQAVVNTPLVQGMNLTTADEGRAEIQFEDGSVARVAPNSSLTLGVLTGSGAAGDAEMTLDHGLAYFELQGTGQVGQMAVHFGDNTITASGFTVMRITDDTPPGEIAVFSGNAHIDRASGSPLDLHGGESISFSSSDPSGYMLAETIQPDSWDSWNSDRDQALAAEASSQTNVPGDLAPGDTSNPAWSDLDSSGSWYNVPGQGYVWSPYDASSAGFDPYGNGSWVWTPGFGYTWASAYSWGYLPYSCGAWNFYGGFGWGWAPGFGGCTPWWGMGYYGGPMIGYAPSWYRPIQRPAGPGGRGFGHGLGPIHTPVRGRPIPVITVHRQPPVLSAGFPSRSHNVPVSIGGQRVYGIRPVGGSQPGYGNGLFAGRPLPGALPARTAPGLGRSTYAPMRPIYASHPQPLGGITGQPGRALGPPSARSWGAPAPHPGGMRTYAPPAGRSAGGSHAPSGGGFHAPAGGGGGFHGGGGGGGGFHGGGGGGGFHGGGGGGGGHAGGGGGGGGHR